MLKKKKKRTTYADIEDILPSSEESIENIAAKVNPYVCIDGSTIHLIERQSELDYKSAKFNFIREKKYGEAQDAHELNYEYNRLFRKRQSQGFKLVKVDTKEESEVSRWEGSDGRKYFSEIVLKRVPPPLNEDAWEVIEQISNPFFDPETDVLTPVGSKPKAEEERKERVFAAVKEGDKNARKKRGMPEATGNVNRAEVDRPGALYDRHNPKVRDGIYTCIFENGDYRTLRVRTQGPDVEFAPNETIVYLLNGPNNETDYMGFCFLKPNGEYHLWKKFRDNREHSDLPRAMDVLLKDPKDAGKAYAKISGNCYRCGRTLTVPVSLHNGVGPECAKKEGY